MSLSVSASLSAVAARTVVCDRASDLRLSGLAWVTSRARLRRPRANPVQTNPVQTP